MKRHPKLQIKGLNTVKLAIVSNVIYRFKTIPIKMTTGFFTEFDRLILNSLGNSRSQNRKNNLEKQSRQDLHFLICKGIKKFNIKRLDQFGVYQYNIDIGNIFLSQTRNPTSHRKNQIFYRAKGSLKNTVGIWRKPGKSPQSLSRQNNSNSTILLYHNSI